jgi:catalase
VFADRARERIIGNASDHMANCRDKEIIKRQIAIFREVSEDLASRLEKATGVNSKVLSGDCGDSFQQHP